MDNSTSIEKRIVIITGVSGAGRSTALNILEDNGFEAIDNLPLALLPALLAQRSGSNLRLAIGIDSRAHNENYSLIINSLKESVDVNQAHCHVVYLDCDDAVLLQRFRLTRRKHPFSVTGGIAASIIEERRLLAPLKALATAVIDTTTTSPAALQQILLAQVRVQRARLPLVHVVSFSYKHGLPPCADLVFDVRFLHNPHYVPDLQQLTGRDMPVQAFINQSDNWESFWFSFVQLINVLMHGYEKEGKNYLTVAIGCSGGKHRSVYVAEQLQAWLQCDNWMTTCEHRELRL